MSREEVEVVDASLRNPRGTLATPIHPLWAGPQMRDKDIRCDRVSKNHRGRNFTPCVTARR
jgi:hypothetical protein